MSNLIGGFSSEQYKAYLHSAPEEKGKSRHWLSHFKLSSCPTLAVWINRLAYFFLNHLTLYPNNAYLFQKFKSHDFSQMDSEAQYDIARKIFVQFQQCSDLDPAELESLEQQLNAVQGRLAGEESDEISDLEDEDESSVEEDDEQEELDSNPESEPQAQEKAKETEPAPKAGEKQDKKVVEEKKTTKDPAKTSGVSKTSETRKTSEAKKSDEKKVETKKADEKKADAKTLESKDEGKKADSKKADEKKASSPQPTDATKKVEEKKEEKSTDKKEAAEGLNAKDKKERETSTEESDDKEEIFDEENDKVSEKGDTSAVEEEEAKDEFFDVAEESGTIPIPDDVENIISKPFPLNDSDSIQDLYQDDKRSAERTLYKQNLQTLLAFDHQLWLARRIEKSTRDSRFDHYLVEADDAFQIAWDLAYIQADVLHDEFARLFPKDAPVLDKQGNVICSVEQAQWVTKCISERFPAIYQLAFDVPALDIYQKCQIASLARAIFMGSAADTQEAEITSSCFIRIAETVDKSTAPLKQDSKDSLLVRMGSFVYTQFVGPGGKVQEKPEEVKKQLAGMAQAYVQNWLEGIAVNLEFGKVVIPGGVSKGGEWVAKVRDAYTQRLKEMTSEELREEIKKATNCPLIKLILKTYAEADKSEDKNSKFPAALMENLFKDSLGTSKPHIQRGIRRTIDDANFSNSQDVAELAKKAKVVHKAIEPLIRIRVLYMICCLGNNTVESIMRGMKQRTQTMYDPEFYCTSSNAQALACRTDARTLRFDENFDELTVTLHTQFTDSTQENPLAQGQSVLTVSSVSRMRPKNVKTSLTDLQDLRFSLYSSPVQMRYLVAQVAPATLSANVRRLFSAMAYFELVKKQLTYEQAKADHNSKRGWREWAWGSNQFDPKPHQTPVDDSKRLDELLSKARELVTYLNTEQMLTHTKQISQEEIMFYVDEIRGDFTKVLAMLDEIYPMPKKETDIEVEAWEPIHNKAKDLRRILDVKRAAIGVAPTDSKEASSSPITSLEEEQEID